MSTNPVILVHGLLDSSRKMARLARHLRECGREVHAIDLSPSWAKVGLDEFAAQVAAFIEKHVPAGQRFDLIGFSMGGLVSRYYLQRLGGLERVDRFISIAAPHNGSLLAWLVPTPGCRQMRPGSAFLRDLESDADQLRKVQFTSLWTPFDLMILPAWSSILSCAKNRLHWCLAHPLMVMQPSALKAVEAALG